MRFQAVYSQQSILSWPPLQVISIFRLLRLKFVNKNASTYSLYKLWNGLNLETHTTSLWPWDINFHFTITWSVFTPWSLWEWWSYICVKIEVWPYTYCKKVCVYVYGVNLACITYYPFYNDMYKASLYKHLVFAFTSCFKHYTFFTCSCIHHDWGLLYVPLRIVAQQKRGGGE